MVCVMLHVGLRISKGRKHGLITDQRNVRYIILSIHIIQIMSFFISKRWRNKKIGVGNNTRDTTYSLHEHVGATPTRW